MEKKLAVIVDNKEVTTEIQNTEMCSSACDVAMETCSSQSHDTCGDGCRIDKRFLIIMKKRTTYLVLLAMVFNLTACSLDKEAVESGVLAEFTDKTWYFYDEVTAENLCLSLGSDGGYSYHCVCGEPIGDSDLFDKYEYDEETGTITLSNGYDNETAEIKVLAYNEYRLLIEIDGEIKDFVLEEMDTTSNFYSFEGEKYFSGYEARCTVVEIADGRLVYGAVNYDPEGLYENGPFEEYELADDYTISEVSVHRYNSIQGDQEYEEFYNVTYRDFSEKDEQLMEDMGAQLAFLWFDEDMRVEKIVFHGETSVTADYISVTVEAEDAEEITQEQLDEEADKENALYDAAHLNEDGSIIYLMTEEQYEKYQQ